MRVFSTATLFSTRLRSLHNSVLVSYKVGAILGFVALGVAMGFMKMAYAQALKLPMECSTL